MNTFLLASGSVVLISLISLIGLTTLAIKAKQIQKFLFLLISLAAGTLIGDVFLHIIPEIAEENEFGIYPYLSMILGLVFFFCLESILHWHHHHGSDHSIETVGINNLVADGIHNLVDGIVIGAAYLVSIELGIATTLAVALHEIPQEIGDFGILLHAGFSKAKALLFNLGSALLAIVGLISVFAFQEFFTSYSILLIGFAGGGFAYIAIADLLPELHKQENLGKKLTQVLFVLLGITTMLLLTFLE